jgi:hypothetical protein
MQDYVLVLQVMGWILWTASVVTVIKVDQRRRTAAAKARPDEIDVTAFEEKSVTPYLVVSCLCGALVLPVYFYATRKSWRGALVGLGFTVVNTLAIVVVLSVLTGPVQRASARARVTSDAAACANESGIGGSWQCLRAGTAYYTGAGVEKDASKTVDLFDRGCQRGDIDACAALLNLGSAQAPAAKIQAARAAGAKLCAATPAPPQYQCQPFGAPAPRLK